MEGPIKSALAARAYKNADDYLHQFAGLAKQYGYEAEDISKTFETFMTVDR